MLITVLAEKLDNTVSQADARRLICNKYHKFLKFLAVFFSQDLVQDIIHDESLPNPDKPEKWPQRPKDTK